MKSDYEMVMGIEVHVELKTKSKIFCGCATDFGAPPNTQCCPVCAGLPGALPVLNRQVVDYAIVAGLATHCAIAPCSKNDRKSYFYPDLPKAYQISQFDQPLCENGYLDIETESGPKRVGITRIHIEEDAGKLRHEGEGTLVDLNRCGVPLIEIVSAPDLGSAAEAVDYLKKLRAVMLYTGISDARMNEGSFRADVNLSVRPKGSEGMGTRTELKNLNSFGFVAKAIEYEFARQVAAVETGQSIRQETRRFDAASGKTTSMRSKEDAEDYRYFPDPDLAPLVIDPAHIEALAKQIPPLPDQRKQLYIERYGLSGYHAEQLVTDRAAADYFEAVCKETRYPSLAASLILGEVFRLAGEGMEEIPLAPGRLAGVADLFGDGQVNSGGAKQLLGALWRRDADPAELLGKLGLEQLSDEQALADVVREVLAQNPGMAADYLAGKTRAMKALMGRAMAATKGRGNPALLQKLLERQLAED